MVVKRGLKVTTWMAITVMCVTVAAQFEVDPASAMEREAKKGQTNQRTSRTSRELSDHRSVLPVDQPAFDRVTDPYQRGAIQALIRRLHADGFNVLAPVPGWRFSAPRGLNFEQQLRADGIDGAQIWFKGRPPRSIDQFEKMVAAGRALLIGVTTGNAADPAQPFFFASHSILHRQNAAHITAPATGIALPRALEAAM